jgi:hypothetical protein
MQFLLIRIAPLVASALLGVGAVSAQTGAIDPDRAHPAVPADTLHPALLEFSMQQRAAIYEAVKEQRPTAPLPFDMQIEVGTKLPQSAELHPLPEVIRAQISGASKYRFALWRDQVLLVDPADTTVADILHGFILQDYK